MAKDKKSVLLYCDIIHTVMALEDDEAGRLFKHYLKYINDLNPESDRLTELLFEPIKQNLKRDLKKWEAELQQRSDAGKKGMEKRWGNKDNTVITKDNTVINTITNITDNVTVNVNDKVKDIQNTIEQRKLKFADTLKPYFEKYGKELLNSFYKYWTQPNKSGTKFSQELQKTWDLSYRLETWAKRDKEFSKNTSSAETNTAPKLTFNRLQL